MLIWLVFITCFLYFLACAIARELGNSEEDTKSEKNYNKYAHIHRPLNGAKLRIIGRCPDGGHDSL